MSLNFTQRLVISLYLCLLIQIYGSKGLECFQCKYIENTEDGEESSASCESEPTLRELVEFGRNFDFNFLNEQQHKGKGVIPAAVKTFCITIAGSKPDGSKVVFRNVHWSSMNTTQVVCAQGKPNDVYFPYENVRSCMCSTDGCNTGNVPNKPDPEKTTTTEGGNVSSPTSTTGNVPESTTKSNGGGPNTTTTTTVPKTTAGSTGYVPETSTSGVMDGAKLNLGLFAFILFNVSYICNYT